MSNTATVRAAPGYLLTVQTNAAWPQRVQISGPINRMIEGVGEGNIIFQSWLPSGGDFVFTFWYRPNGSGDWTPSVAQGGGDANGDNWVQIGTNDGGGDGDYNDTLITFSTAQMLNQSIDRSRLADGLAHTNSTV